MTCHDFRSTKRKHGNGKGALKAERERERAENIILRRAWFFRMFGRPGWNSEEKCLQGSTQNTMNNGDAGH